LWRDFCAPMASSPRISRADHQAADDGSDCAFAVKPRAFGAPQAALGLDRSAHPSKGLSMPQMQSGDVTK